MTAQAEIGLRVAGETETLTQRVAPWLLVSCIGFNFVLSVLNAHGFSVSGTIVQLVQLTVTAATLATLLFGDRPRVRSAFPIAIAIFVAVILLSEAINGAFDPKALYDVLMLCIFICLGAAMREVRIATLDRIMVLVFAVALFEFFLPETYVDVVNPLSYYANTRDWVASQVVGGVVDPGLYLGSVRTGGEAWFGVSIAGHRVGGIFLEPLSQGYFAAIMAIAYSFYARARLGQRLLRVGLCLLLALMSDTRLAVVAIGVTLIVSPLYRRLPIGPAYFVPALAALAATAWYMQFHDGDEFSEIYIRLATTFDVLFAAPWWQAFLGGLDTTHANDAGIIYLMAHGGVIGLLLFFPLATGMLSSERRDAQMIYLVLTYLLITCLFTAAFVTIKTAALLGFIVGAAGSGAFRPLEPSRPHDGKTTQ